MGNSQKLPFYPMDKQLISSNEREKAYELRIKGEPLPPPQYVSHELQGIILKAAAYKPEDRYVTPREMRRDLESLQDKRNRVEPSYSAAAAYSAAQADSMSWDSPPDRDDKNSDQSTLSDGSVVREEARVEHAASNAPVSQVQHKSRRKAMIVFIACIAVLLAFAGLYFFGGMKDIIIRPTPTPLVTESPTPTPTPTPTVTPTPSPTPSPDPSPTPSPTQAPTPSPTLSPTPSLTPSPTPTPTASLTPSPTPSLTSSPTLTSTASPVPTTIPVLGDINGDGVATLQDYIILERFLTLQETGAGYIEEYDVNQDGLINSGDAVVLKRILEN